MSKLDHNQEILYRWTLEHLRLLKAEGEMFCPDRSPLSTAQIVEVLELIAKAPEYRQQTLSVPDRDGKRSFLRYVDGEPRVEASVVQDEPHEQRLPYGASILIRDDT